MARAAIATSGLALSMRRPWAGAAAQQARGLAGDAACSSQPRGGAHTQAEGQVVRRLACSSTDYHALCLAHLPYSVAAAVLE